MIKKFKAWREKRRREKAMAEGAEAFIDQFLFTGRQGLMDGECDYAIAMMLKAKYPPKPFNEGALKNHVIQL